MPEGGDPPEIIIFNPTLKDVGNYEIVFKMSAPHPFTGEILVNIVVVKYSIMPSLQEFFKPRSTVEKKKSKF